MAFAEIVNDRLVVQTEWSEKDLVKQVPGSRWDPVEKVWTLPLAWASCVIARGVFGSMLRIGPELNEWAKRERTARVDLALDIRDLIDWRSDVIAGHLAEFPTSTDNDHDELLYPFQLVGREFLRVAGDVLLADAMGTGKSVQVLAALRRIMECGDEALPALIVCPNSVKQHWVDHVNDWLPEANPYLITGSAAVRRKTLAEAADDPNAIVVMNIEAVRLLSRVGGFGSIRLLKCRECDPVNGDERLTAAKCEVHDKPLNGFGFRTCVLDEAHRVKDPRAKQTRAIWATFHDESVRRRWALTGTPIANHPGDLWSTMHAVAPSEYATKSKFIDRYAMLSWNAFGGMDITGLRLDTRAELFKFFDPRFRRMTKELVLPQLPPKVRVTHHVDMSPKQKKAYDEVAATLVTELDDGSLLVARSSLTAQTRLLQLASSYCEIDRGPDPADPAGWQVELREPSPKVDALIDILDDLGIRDPMSSTSVAVSAEHRRLLELAGARLDKEKIPYVVITGAVSDVQRALNLERFQAGDVRVLLFTYKAGGVGLNMTKASTLVRLQRSWSLVDNKQGEDRVHRIGSEQHDVVTIIDVVTAGTVEVDQQQRLGEKLRRLEEINRDRARLVAAGRSTSSLDDEEAQLMSAHLGEE